SSGSSGSSGSTTTGTKTVTGDTVQTRWGPVQVKITVKNGKITDVTAVQYPSDNPRDQEINSYALPQLKSEALAAQSASIDTVSGATYTSDGYRQSLQSALDSAGL
ncbi:FMN-binding protein, partial [Streptomyces sp. NPDC001100]